MYGKGLENHSEIGYTLIFQKHNLIQGHIIQHIALTLSEYPKYHFSYNPEKLNMIQQFPLYVLRNLKPFYNFPNGNYRVPISRKNKHHTC